MIFVISTYLFFNKPLFSPNNFLLSLSVTLIPTTRRDLLASRSTQMGPVKSQDVRVALKMRKTIVLLSLTTTSILLPTNPNRAVSIVAKATAILTMIA